MSQDNSVSKVILFDADRLLGPPSLLKCLLGKAVGERSSKNTCKFYLYASYTSSVCGTSTRGTLSLIKCNTEMQQEYFISSDNEQFIKIIPPIGARFLL
jgi:hypothetical protein